MSRRLTTSGTPAISHPARLARFERVFGKASYELRFDFPISDPVLNRYGL